ncbi:SIR2 family NAD-dependent protein deacylase [Tepidiforma sp.]|uniref:SIR2 family NAD-dependent protein deacylase n=1 Tax=Tepidiforma sp. TaxID=2682230 RepID=UPI002ADD6CAA|nr:Sir2 family NAD-dependent protein deacetylase [Tepidiforma sp.]
MAAALESPLAEVADWLRQSRSTVVLTGAGISTESGIPDFRGPNGLWTRNPGAEKAATLQNYLADREVRVRAWRSRVEHGLWTEAEPNGGHLAIAALERKGRLDLLITQNIDSLHLKAGNSLERMVEIHGNLREYVCMQCGDRGPIERVLERVRAGEDDPPCRRCGGILKSATISFGQNLVAADYARSEAAAARCELFLAIGTSLTVYPVAYLPEVALRNGARLVIINAQETPYDGLAHALIREQIGQVLPRIVAAV